MTAYCKNAGIWQPVAAPFVRNAGLWKPPSQGFARVSGIWQPFLAQPVASAFQAFTTHTNEAQTVTFSSIAFGTPSSGRYIFMLVPYYHGTTTNRTISSATIGGVTATIHACPTSNNGTYGGIALISALVPTGTSGTVTLTFNSSGAGFYRPRIAVYAVTNLQSMTPFDLVTVVNSNTGAPRTFTCSQPKDGVVFFGTNVWGNSTTRTMSGITADFNVSPITSMQYIGGDALSASAGTASATVTGGSTGVWAAVMASFR